MIYQSIFIFKPFIYADDTALSATLKAFGNVNQNFRR